MSDTAHSETALAPAARLGSELRTRRQGLGWELPELAQSLRIRLPYLEAIEAGQIGELPGTTYALGFVRAYASALGLNGEQMVGRFRAEAGAANTRPALSFPVPVPQRGVPAGALMLLGLVILAGAYTGWYYVSEHQRTPAETVPPIPDRLRPAVQQPTPSPQVASILPTASAPAPQPPADPAHGPQAISPLAAVQSGAVQAGAVQSGAVRSGAIQAGATQSGATQAGATQSGATQSGAMQPGAVQSGAVQPGAMPSPAQPPAATPPALNPAVQAPRQAANPAASPAAAATRPATPGATQSPVQDVPAGTRIILKVNADAWITIKQPGGAPALNRLMHAGETWPVPAGAPGLLLTTGNAGGTELDVDGTPILTLGGSGAVRRDLKLDADALKAGPLPPLGHSRKPPAPVDQG